ncbi:hypothetical protein DEO72_LG7g1838 [Vigna unguiculata]|uniref:Uncharacterized protein n=1 Tax=Vigna unguiculata TaxID=3917 RepID=A0A4D6MHP8_VIGUN|nr:hypothetical protein DEO72_LG7g1838 [Vigna unguiculata]
MVVSSANIGRRVHSEARAAIKKTGGVRKDKENGVFKETRGKLYFSLDTKTRHCSPTTNTPLPSLPRRTRDVGDDAVHHQKNTGDHASPSSFFSNARETGAALIPFMASRTRLSETVVSEFSHLKVVAGPAVTVEGITTSLAREDSAARHHATIPSPFSRPHATRFENATRPHSTVDELRFAGGEAGGGSLLLVFYFDLC